MSDQLHKQIAEIVSIVETAKQRGAPSWPMNEANTERIVVEPILRALGYGPLDYSKRIQSAGADYPDYVVLPGSDHEWILEAKEWEMRLDPRFERQAVNYANNNGAQWAVLTNGRTWWVYNTRAPGDLSQQRVYELMDLLDVEGAAKILAYLSKGSILEGGIDRAYRAREISSAVAAALRTSRKITSAIRLVVGSNLDRHVTNEEISEAVNDLLDIGPETPPAEASTQPATTIPSTVIDSPTASLAMLCEEPAQVTGRRPLSVRLAGGQAIPVQTWRDVVLLTLRETGAVSAVSLPFLAGPRAKRFFLSSDPHHLSGEPMTAPHLIELDGQRVFAELHYAARNLVSILASVLDSAGIDTATCVLEMADAADTE